MLVKHWQRVAETRFKYHKKIQMAVDEARACRHPHGLKDKLKPNPTQQDALKGILPLKMLMCGKVTHKDLIESSPTIPKIKGKINRFLKTCMVKYDYE